MPHVKNTLRFVNLSPAESANVKLVTTERRVKQLKQMFINCTFCAEPSSRWPESSSTKEENYELIY